jgi:hypothetical protein
LEQKIHFVIDSPPFPSDDVFTLMSLFIIAIVRPGLGSDSSWKYRQLKRSCQTRTVVPATSLTIPHHTNRKVLTKKYSDVTIEKCFFLSI